MKDMNEVLLTGEKAVLRKLGLAALLLLAGSFLFFIRVRDYHSDLKNEMLTATGRIASTRMELSRAKERLELWRQAGLDVEEVRSRRIFGASTAVQDMRLGLQSIFDEAGVGASDLSFAYADQDRERLGKITVTFTFRGRYPAFKKLLGIIEKDPRFLVVEKLDFQDTGTGSGLMRIRFTLAGYHGV